MLLRLLPQLTVEYCERELEKVEGEAFSLLGVSGRSWQQMNFLSCVTENVLYLL